MDSRPQGSLFEVHSSVKTGNKVGWRKLFAFFGPAYLISVGYMDPGNWATDLAGGSQFGYQLIWVLLLSNLIAILLQSLSARLGIVSGLDLAQASRNAYPKWANIPLYLLAQTAIVACDLAEIIGMAIGLNLLFNIPLIWGISITIFDTILLLFLLHKGIRIMEGFIISMVFVVGASFLLEMFIVKPSGLEIIEAFKPSILSGNSLYIAIGIIGATVMPHNLYLHSSLVQTRRIEKTYEGKREALRYNLFDTTIALNLAFFVNAAILILAATAFYKNGLFQVAEIQDAHKLLNDIFGSMAPTLFAIALIAAGQSSTITGTLAGQIVMEGHLNLRIEPWIRRLITRLLAIIPAFVTILYFGESALGKLLILSQVVLSLQLGFAVIPLIHFTSSKKLMQEFAIRFWVKALAWISAIIIISLNAKLVVEEIYKWVHTAEHTWWIYCLVIPAVLSIAGLLLYILAYPLLHSAVEKAKVPHGEALNFIENTPASYRHIGITIGFTDKDVNTIQHAILQGGKEAKYTLIHIVETAGARYYGDQVSDLETNLDIENLKKYQDNLATLGYTVETIIGYGTAAKAIVKIVNNQAFDLLVMGAHGHRNIKDLLFGTTVNKVRHQVKTPVLIIN
ncbi:MAG: Nramp family divalent metal transporter [Sphingobacteriaceae bacterium]